MNRKKKERKKSKEWNESKKNEEKTPRRDEWNEN